MATITTIARFIGKTVAAIDVSASGNIFSPYDLNIVNNLTFTGGTETLTAAKLDLLLGGGDASTLHDHDSLYAALSHNHTGVYAPVSHNHDDLYFTETELGSTTDGSAGADLIGGENKSYTNISGLTSFTVQDFIDRIDAALSVSGADTFSDSLFRIQDDGDDTKQLAFEVSAITTGTTRTITMPDSNVNLGLLATAIQRNGSVAFTAAQSMGGFKITNLADGTAASDAVNKSQLDAIVAGLSPKQAVRIRTTAALPAATYDNGTAGVGATLTANANGAFPEIDGITVISSDVNNRILVMNQAAGLQNGVYELTQTGDGSTPWILTRADDLDGSPTHELNLGTYVSVMEGTLYERGSYILTAVDTNANGYIDIGSEAMTWEVFRLPDEVSASGFLDRTGNLITLKNLAAANLIIGNGSGVATTVDTASVGDIAASTSTGLTIKASAVTTAALNDLAVTEAKIAASAVTTAKINDLAVTEGKLADSAVANAKIANLAVTTGKLADDSVTKAKLNADVAGDGILQETDGSLSVRGVYIALTNGSGSSISGGNIVRISAAGSFSLAQATSLANSEGTVGVLAATTANGATGKVLVSGQATITVAGGGDLTPGQQVWLSKATAGAVTQSNTGGELSSTGNTIVPVGIATGLQTINLDVGLPIEVE